MKKFRIEFRWGLIFSLVLMIWMFIEKSLGWHDKYIGSQLLNHFLTVTVIYIVVYYLGLKEKRDSYYNGVMTWQQGLLSGGVISVVIAILSPFTQYFIYHYISPNYFHNIITYQVEQNGMTQKGADFFFTMKSYMIQAVFSNLSMGIVVSAILALFLKKKKES